MVLNKEGMHGDEVIADIAAPKATENNATQRQVNLSKKGERTYPSIVASAMIRSPEEAEDTFVSPIADSSSSFGSGSSSARGWVGASKVPPERAEVGSNEEGLKGLGCKEAADARVPVVTGTAPDEA